MVTDGRIALNYFYPTLLKYRSLDQSASFASSLEQVGEVALKFQWYLQRPRKQYTTIDAV